MLKKVIFLPKGIILGIAVRTAQTLLDAFFRIAPGCILCPFKIFFILLAEPVYIPMLRRAGNGLIQVVQIVQLIRKLVFLIHAGPDSLVCIGIYRCDKGKNLYLSAAEHQVENRSWRIPSVHLLPVQFGNISTEDVAIHVGCCMKISAPLCNEVRIVEFVKVHEIRHADISVSCINDKVMTAADISLLSVSVKKIYLFLKLIWQGIVIVSVQNAEIISLGRGKRIIKRDCIALVFLMTNHMYGKPIAGITLQHAACFVS